MASRRPNPKTAKLASGDFLSSAFKRYVPMRERVMRLSSVVSVKNLLATRHAYAVSWYALGEAAPGELRSVGSRSVEMAVTAKSTAS